MNKLTTYFSLLLLISLYSQAYTQVDSLVITQELTTKRIGKYLSIYEDASNSLDFQNVLLKKDDFFKSDTEIPNFEVTSSTYWVRFILHNQTDVEQFMLEYEKITADKLLLYYKTINSSLPYKEIKFEGGKKNYENRMFLFDFNIPKDQSVEFYMAYKTNWATTFPIIIGTKENVLKRVFTEELVKGIYFGVLFVMTFYNLFIYFSIRDKSYLYYVIYILSFILLQLNDLGYTYKFWFYNQPICYDTGIKILPSITCITAILFVRLFLKTKIHTPKLHQGFTYFIYILIASFGFAFYTQDNSLFFLVVNLLTFITAIYLLVVGIVISWQGYNLAKFFLVAWLILLVSIIQFNLSNLNLIPYHEITDHSLEIGSLIEVFLLSLALAYHINILKQEKELSQAKTIELIEDKKRIIENQNLELERLVAERTKKLEQQNKIISEKNEEKSIMMREIHHRVKNNLQMINSMVRLQSRYLNKENIKSSLREIQKRIHTMSILHEKIYQSENLVLIDVKEYIDSIISEILSLYSSDKNISYTVTTTDKNYSTESVLYLGLIITELTTNALKHAFKGINSGHISVYLYVNPENKSVLQVTNNGARLDVNRFNESKSLGHRLIKNFVRQLNGELEIINDNNLTSFVIAFTD